MKLSEEIYMATSDYSFIDRRSFSDWAERAEELEAQIDKLKDALNKIERHRDSTLWPQNETVESMARIAKETLEMLE